MKTTMMSAGRPRQPTGRKPPAARPARLHSSRPAPEPPVGSQAWRQRQHSNRCIEPSLLYHHCHSSHSAHTSTSCTSQASHPQLIVLHSTNPAMAGFMRGGAGAGAGRAAYTSSTPGAYGSSAGGAAPPSRDAYRSAGAAGGAGYGGGGAGFGAPPPGRAAYGSPSTGSSRSRPQPPPRPDQDEKAHPSPANPQGYLVVKCPEPLILSNCVAVNGQEWRGTQYILIDGKYVFTAA